MAEIAEEETFHGTRKVRSDEHPEVDANGIGGREEKGDDEAKKIVEGESNVTEEKEKEKKKEGWFKGVIGKMGLDMVTVMMMFKGSVAPTIGIAFFQADSVAATFSSLGYLVPIISVIAMPIMPRAKYLQTLVLNLLGICIGSAVALLGIWSSVQARLHTSVPGSKGGYNSSQAAVCAIWLFVNIWFVNTLRAKIPALQFPAILYSVFTNIVFTFGPLLPTMASGEALIKQLLEGFLTAFALATAVNLFVIPVTSRTVVFKEQAGYIGLIRGTLKAQKAYLTSLETSDMFAPANTESADSNGKDSGKKKAKKDAHPARNAQAKALKGSLDALLGLHGKLHGDLPFAKREIAWGKLDQKDLDEIYKLFIAILIPLIGMGTITDIFERIAERRGWVQGPKSTYREAEKWEECGDETKEKEKATWNTVMKALHEPFEVATQAMDEALEHASLLLELTPKPKQKQGDDVEAKAENPKPGDTEFTKYLDQKVLEFYGKRGETLRAWAKQKGLSEDQFNSVRSPGIGEDWTPDEAQHRRDQQQLYLILYLENLLYSCGIAISNLTKFADQKVADGTMKKNRLIAPGLKRLKKWVLEIGKEDVAVDNESPDSLEAGVNTVYLGSGFNPRRDPEHLPPTTAWQHFGNGIRTIPHFLGSAESAFGFRVGCATLCIGIVAFLKETQTFFMEQRLVWAMIIIAIGMSMTSGQSLFGFFGRIAGTAVSMVLSIVVWYIPDQKTPGVIVFLWLAIFIHMYFFLKFPRFIPIFLVSMVTLVLIVGYELQVRKIGLAAATASGQPYYPIYELAPYRLACVAAGSFVAFIWTIFPYPLSDRSWLRKDLGSTLYLLANYYSVVHSTIRARMRDREGDMSLKTSPGKALEKARRKIFGKLVLLLPSLQQHADWQKWEPTIGGKFPKETYEGITLRATNIMNYLSLMAYATQSWTKDSNSPSPTNPNATDPNNTTNTRREWLNDLTRLIDSIGPTSHSITSILTLLSASVKQGSSLPPYITLPSPYDLSRRLETLDKGILDARHVAEPGYSAYAVMQVCSSLVTDDLRALVGLVRDLVGETDFEFVVGGSVGSLDGSVESEGDKGKRD